MIDERDPKRFFGRREKTALFLAADGRCEICGVDLHPDWQADHIKAWSKGGDTDVINGQALCPKCNLKKGSSDVITFEKLRKWQKRFVTKFQQWAQVTFLLVALPGGGKTIAALYATAEWIRAAVGKPRFMIVVVPSRNLKRQWRKTAKKSFGLELQMHEFKGDLKPGMHGCVVTYNAVAADSLVFRRLCAKFEVIVIFDEVHHVGESAAWGEGVREAFDGAARRLAMSGTPWRSDGGQIPFLTPDLETGEYSPHERFDWPEALTEDPAAVRELAFRPYHGFAEYDQNGDLVRLDSRDDDLADEDIARCLRGRIFEQQFCTDMLRDAHTKLMELREMKSDAAGIVVCVDINHATNVARWLKDVTGETPVIAVSDDEVAPGEPVEAFGATGATAKWIVSVRQVSEGVDIPRMMVGVYLTNYTTELFFRQFIGRVARNQGTDVDKEACIFYPDHPTLNKYVAGIMHLQAIAIKRRTEKDPKEGGGERVPSSITYLGGSGAEFAGLILPTIDEQRLAPAQAHTVFEFARRYGVSDTAARRILEDFQGGFDFGGDCDDRPVTGNDELPLEERLDKMRKDQNRRVGRWWNLIGKTRPFEHLNNESNEHVGCTSVKTAT